MIVSSVYAPRSVEAIGAPTFANSDSLQPTPKPAMSRPPERASSVASSFASTTALRIGTTITLAPRRISRERPATQASVVTAS